MAKYRLTAKHYWRDQLLNEGTLVGDDTPHPVPPEGPTLDMEPLDDDAKAKIAEFKEKVMKPLPPAPQLGLVYLEPDSQAAFQEFLKTQAGAAPKKAPETAKPKT